MQQQDDVYFVEQVLAGNKQAFAFIINRYKNRIYAMVLRMVKNPEDAKDLVQECFIKIDSLINMTGKEVLPAGCTEFLSITAWIFSEKSK
ncbi:RNA polymerase sigma factor [Sutcliffiella horikoshii]|uniref:RNA polymerase sigma factor n=1 Tax=Sutcliffiella horikoshii TaxID=79883 RepID=UPI001CFE883C|nr:sigma factor [Sutcliffiella horikoshii]